MTIPKDLISTKWKKVKGEDAIKIIVSRFKWESEKVFRVVNVANLDCWYEIRSHDPNDAEVEQRHCVLISVTKIDNCIENLVRLDCPHFLSHKSSLPVQSVLKRLIRCN